MKPQKIMRKLDIEKLRNKKERDKHEEKIYERMIDVKTDNVQDKWKETVKACIETVGEIISRKRSNKKVKVHRSGIYIYICNAEENQR